MTKLDAGLITLLPAYDSGSAAVWGSKRINPRPQSCLCPAWSGCPSNVNDDTSEEMKKTVVKEIVQSNSKISLIMDESTTINKKTTLIVYVRCYIEGVGMNSPINLFLDLVELEKETAEGVFDSLLKCLHSHGMTEDYLKKYLVSLACDGAAVMLGCKSGVKKLLSERFPSIIVWHCANHRLELTVGDAVKKTSGINRFKSFIDKLYVIYHASPKNRRELHLCAELLGAELLKIGRILSTRWVSSSLRTVLAVWNNFESLVYHFSSSSSLFLFAPKRNNDNN